ncbi:MAG: prepilin-type N-terminal cleavage/methylation domain-containing protein [Chloroflexi bacterium]|nr:prepilin-type N-terminal cleavage/methylation domain-containing protein [Chloroflexota bacterium]
MIARAASRQRGFTLIELLAVMAILAVLVAIVAPAVAGSREASLQAQALQDAMQVRTAANKFFGQVQASEVRTSHMVTTTTLLPANSGQDAGIALLEPATQARQMVSSRWPEKFITRSQNPPADVSTIGAGYADVVQTGLSPIVDSIVVLGSDGKTLAGKVLLERYTAVDLDTLATQGFLARKPAAAELRSDNVPNFLWLFEKTSSSSAAERSDDSRDVVVFKLVKVEKIEGTDNVRATFGQVLGEAPTPAPTATSAPASTATPTPTPTATATPTATPDGRYWAARSSLPTGRTWVAAAAGPDGKIYALGGGSSSPAVEAYDPVMDSWAAKTPLPIGVYGAGAATGSDGRIYVVSGSPGGGMGDALQIYDPSGGSWVLGPSLPFASWVPAAAAGLDGRIYVFGGQASTSKLQIYDPVSNAWSSGLDLPEGRFGAAAVRGADGRIYVFGGMNYSSDPILLNSLNIYDPTANTWSVGAPLGQRRVYLAGALGPDGRIYAMGGADSYSITGGTVYSNVEAYDPAANTWSAAPNMPTGQAGAGAARGADGDIYVIGGAAPGWQTNINQSLVFP